MVSPPPSTPPRHNLRDRGGAVGARKAILSLGGEHDLSTLPAIEGAFVRMAESGTTVIVDCSKVGFVDSSVAGALVRRARAGEFVLVVAPRGGAARRVFDLIGLASVLGAFETRDDR